MIRIAGRPVKIGDELYHTGKNRWGRIVRFDVNSAVLRITADGGDELNYIERFVTEGGVDSGKKVVYWHEPINLDLPYRDLTKVKRMLDFLMAELQ